MPTKRRTQRSRTVQAPALVILVLVISFACYAGYEWLGGEETPQDPQPFETPVPSNTLPAFASPTAGGGPVQLYFTDPGAPGASSLTGGPDEPIAAAIDAAREGVDIAIYNLNLESIRDALLRAAERGVSVRLVMESDALDGDVPQELMDAGIEIIGDGREALMHNKFIVIDGREVWTGSMNLTRTGAYADNNHMVRIQSGQMAANYAAEFNEMFERDEFGPSSTADTPYPELTLAGRPVRTYFSPEDGVESQILPLLENAQEEVYFLAYSFTSDPFGEALVDLYNSGVAVHGVFEEAQVASNTGTEWDRLLDAGLDVRMDGNPGQMHHKVFVIDGEWVVLGSYNFSASAEDRNDENVIIVQDPGTAQQFIAEFQKVYAQGHQ